MNKFVLSDFVPMVVTNSVTKVMNTGHRPLHEDRYGGSYRQARRRVSFCQLFDLGCIFILEHNSEIPEVDTRAGSTLTWKRLKKC